MIRRSGENVDIQLKVGHLRVFVAFLLGVGVTLGYLHYTREKQREDWDNDFSWPEQVNLPTLSDEEIAIIKKTYDKGATCEKTEEHPGGCAYVTLVTHDEYVELALVLVESIRATSSKYPLVALVTPQVTDKGIEFLAKAEIIVEKVEKLSLPDTVNTWGDYWMGTFSKLHIFGLTNYERVVYLDADSLAMSSLDPLFLEHGEFLSATDHHLCKHETSPGMSSMAAVAWPSEKIEEKILDHLNNSHHQFPRGDQSVTEDFFDHHRHSIHLLNETWMSFVFRCQCDDYPEALSLESGPRSVHFTAWFRPHLSVNGVSVPLGLSPKAKECAKPYYNHWEEMWELAVKKQGMTKEEMLKATIRIHHNATQS